jgi:hypothetical protein
VSLVSEADERLHAGPRGAKGERGERGLSRIQGRAIVVLFLICALGIVGNLFWTGHETAADNAHWHQAVAETQQKFCGVVGGFTATPVSRPSDPSANPSRETNYVWYERFVSLDRGLGCAP